MEHLGTKTLETKRLILRKFSLSDAENMYSNWANDPEVTKYLSWKTYENVEVAKQTLTNWIELYDKKDFYQWAIVLKDINEVIGSISVVNQKDDIQMVHIGYCIGKQYWNRGITTEALTELIRFFFEEVDANRVESMHNVYNTGSGKVMEKAGMQFESILRQSVKDNTGINDVKMYSILKDEYFKNK